MQEIPADDPMLAHPDDTSFLDALDDPVRSVADLQRLGSVLKGECLDSGRFMRFGDIVFPNILAASEHMQTGVFAAITWDAGRQVYLNPGIFSSSVFEASSGKHWGPNISIMDPPDHTEFRAIVQRGFMPKQVASWETKIVQPLLEGRFRAIRSKGHADLVRELTTLFPYEVVGAVVGFSHTDMLFVADALKKIMQGLSNPEAAHQASLNLKTYTRNLIEQRRADPKEDIVSAMTLAEVSGNRIPDETFIGMVIHLMQGALDTVFRMSGTITHLLLDYPDQFERLKCDRSLIPSLIEEALRYQGVASSLPRFTVRDTELLGVHIPKGAIVWVVHAAINRDPSRWNNPHTFDIGRPSIQHMAFGNGPHSCIGMHLARAELKEFIKHLLDDLPDLRWDPNEAHPKINGWTNRGASTLPVVWTPRTTH